MLVLVRSISPPCLSSFNVLVSSSTVSSILSLPDSPKSTLDPPVGESSKSAVGHLPAKRARTVKSYAYDAMDDDELDFEAGKKKSKGSKKKVDRESKGSSLDPITSLLTCRDTSKRSRIK